MYKQGATAPMDEAMCGVCNKFNKVTIHNFRVDLYVGKKGMILGNDLFTEYICIPCLNETLRETKRELE